MSKIKILMAALTLLTCPTKPCAQTFTDMTHLLQPNDPIGTKGFQRGASAVDFNNDGFVDIYHSNFRNDGRLYLNKNGEAFVDIIPEISLDEGTNMWGAAFGDYDNDGYLDILFEDLSAASKLYRNNGNRTFTEVTKSANVILKILAQGAAWQDFNADGTLDFLIVNDIGPNQLLKNLDFEKFSDISAAANVETFGNSYGIAWGDLDNDGDPDAFITTCHPTNPLRSINHLLRNNGDETFTNIAVQAGVADSLPSWAALTFDYDRDGWLDIFVSNSNHDPMVGYNKLWHNNHDGTFTNTAFTAGIAGASTENSYGASVADFDNDGWPDLYITSLDRLDRLYRNNGNGTFTDIAPAAGITMNEHRSLAVADFNNDGWIDIFTTGQPQNRLLFNNGGPNNWLRISTRGKENNHYGVGTRVHVYVDSSVQIQDIQAGDSFCSQNHNLTAHFGLGSASKPDSIILHWPDGKTNIVQSGPLVEQGEVVIAEGGEGLDAPAPFGLMQPADGTNFSLTADSDPVDFTWQQALTRLIDALPYRLNLYGRDLWTNTRYDTTLTDIPDRYTAVQPTNLRDNTEYKWTVEAVMAPFFRTSTDIWSFSINPFGDLFTEASKDVVGQMVGQGAGASWGDIDGDGDPDLFIANASAEPNLLFINNGDGKFMKVSSGEIVQETLSSFGGTFGDYDNDGDLDIFVGNINGKNNSLFENDGSGTFSQVTDIAPVIDGGNSFSSAWADFDNDGNLDLFVANAGNEPDFLYQGGGGGSFHKITDGEIVNEASTSFGAAWGDYNNDGFIDLFVAKNGDNALFQNNGDGSFSKISNTSFMNTASSSRGGTWGDFDNDGDLDLYVANLGNNLFYENNGDGSFTQINSGEPVAASNDSRSAHWGDFDSDGDLDLFVGNVGADALYLNNGDKTFVRMQNDDFLNESQASNAAASADFDNDGDLDLCIAHLPRNLSNLLLENNRQNHSWLKVKPVGRQSNTSAIGAKIRVKADIMGKPVWQTRQISAQSGFASQNELPALFGLGRNAMVDSVVVEWPSGKFSYLLNVVANQFLIIDEDSALVSVDLSDDVIPEFYSLEQNFPNPFNPETSIRYQLRNPEHVRITIFNMRGEQVVTLIDAPKNAGRHSVRWLGLDYSNYPVASGVYIYQIKAGTFLSARKLLLLK